MYDSRQWKVLRQQVLSERPFCTFCLRLGIRTKATIVDHIKPHHGRAAIFFDRENLQPLCFHHHNATKQAIERNKRNAGHTVDGRPRSRSHPWNRPRVG